MCRYKNLGPLLCVCSWSAVTSSSLLFIQVVFISSSGVGLLSNAILAFCEPAGYHVPGYLIFSIAKLCVSVTYMRGWNITNISCPSPSHKRQSNLRIYDNWDRWVHLCNISKQTIPLKYLLWLWTSHICYIMYRIRKVINYLKGNFPAVFITSTGREPMKGHSKDPMGGASSN